MCTIVLLCTHIMPRNCIYSISFTEETDSVSINSCCSGSSHRGEVSNTPRGGGSRSPSPKLKPNRTSLDLQPTWIRRSFEQLHCMSQASMASSSTAGLTVPSGSGLKNPHISKSTGNLTSAQWCVSNNSSLIKDDCFEYSAKIPYFPV